LHHFLLGGLIADEGDNHAVKVEEEHDQVEAKLDEGFLLMDVELAENLGSIQEMGVVDDLLDVPCEERDVEQQGHPVAVDQEEQRQESVHSGLGNDVRVEAVAEVDGVDVVTEKTVVLASPCHGGRCDLIASAMASAPGDRGCVPFQIAVHDGEEDLQEKVDGVDQHRQEEQPCFSRHHCGGRGGRRKGCRLAGRGRATFVEEL
jgi:hypothetical protein